ncbi:DinB family protein [Mucilaginibacter boryungensis]|uniref:DinB family protein n=1 Tax=Mucilaginibacter boryungensis TaxID=768480 RepID=A0ABR9XDH4_9SPHI|nr:DinB family protein [Mucilaginibacter boryungensis]MBE9665447.1 DinB family protein [Mucilaginibacter boryungensis]
MISLLQEQYNDIKSARQVLLNYCDNMNNADLFKPVEVFNSSTINQLLVHNANVYLHWLQYFDQEFSGIYFDERDINTIEDLENIYARVNEVVNSFIIKYQDNYLQPFSKNATGTGVLITTTPLQLFTHVITHEFHHKGQILTISRLLGHTPVDTDVIRT